jgi:hypothetical protein
MRYYFLIAIWSEYEKHGADFALLPHQVLQQVRRGFRLPRPDQCPDKVWDLMLRCWLENPDDRPTFDKLARRIAVELEVVVATNIANDRRSKFPHVEPQSKPVSAPPATAGISTTTSIAPNIVCYGGYAGEVTTVTSMSTTITCRTPNPITDHDHNEYDDDDDDDDDDYSTSGDEDQED